MTRPDEGWLPLSVRTGRKPLEGPHDGVPPHLAGYLKLTVQALLENEDYSDLLKDAIFRLKIPCDNWGYRASKVLTWTSQQDDNMLDLLDFIAQFIRDHPPEWPGALFVQIVDEALSAGGSAWRFAEGRLVRRVEDAAQDAYEAAAAKPDKASEELRTAWVHVFGRDPDASDGWDHTIKALEELLCPLVCPKAAKPTLGIVIAELNKPELWEKGRFHLAIAPNNPAVTQWQVFVDMLRLIWPNPDRHGGGPKNKIPDLEEARTIVHLGVTTVQWIRAGVLTVDHSK